MAQENFFALLGDQETDDVSKLIDTLTVKEPLKPAVVVIAAAATADDDDLEKKKEQNPKQKFQVEPHDMTAKRIILPRHVQRSFLVLRKEKKDEPKPQRDSQTTKKAEKKDAQIKAAATIDSNGQQQQQPSSDIGGDKSKNFQGKSHHNDNGHQQGQTQINYYHRGRGNFRVGIAYQGNYRNNHNNGVGNGYRKDYDKPDSHQVNDNNNNNGGYRGGRGRQGRGLQQWRRVHENNGNEKEGQAAAYNGNNNKKPEEISERKDQGQGGYRGEGPRGPQGYYRRGGSKYYNNNGVNNNGGDHKMSDDGGSSNNGDNKKSTNLAVVAPEKGQEVEESNNGEGKKKSKEKKKKSDDKSKGVEDKSVTYYKGAEWERERKLMTLKEYEKSLIEKKKPLEALKKDTAERKVMADEEFGSIKMIGKKKDQEKSQEKNRDGRFSTTSHSHNFSEEAKLISMSFSYYGQLRPNWRRVNKGSTGNEEKKEEAVEEEQRPYNYNGGGGQGSGDDEPHIDDLGQFPVLESA